MGAICPTPRAGGCGSAVPGGRNLPALWSSNFVSCARNAAPLTQAVRQPENMSQPQLLQIPLDPGDVVYTPDWVAADMVAHFKPSGRVLEPCAGDGVFLKYLPGAEWCEIQKGRDFFAWHKPVDWLFGNPPYNNFSAWLAHSLEVARDIVYLLPCNKAFNSYAMMERVSAWGGLVAMRVYGPGSKLNFPVGYAAGAIHYRKGYIGPMSLSMFAHRLSNNQFQPTGGVLPVNLDLLTSEGDPALEVRPGPPPVG